jgi:hypothetical protein
MKTEMTEFERSMLEETKRHHTAMEEAASKAQRPFLMDQGVAMNLEMADEHSRIRSKRATPHVDVEIPISCEDPELSSVVRATLVCVEDCHIDPRPGCRRVQNLANLDLSDCASKARARLMMMVEGHLNEARRRGDKTLEHEVLTKIESPRGLGEHQPGVKQLVYASAHKPALQRTIGKYVEDLVRDGVVRLASPEAQAAIAATAEENTRRNGPVSVEKSKEAAEAFAKVETWERKAAEMLAKEKQ